MRVLLLNKYYGARGGAESVVMQTKRLVERAGHEVVFFGMDRDEAEPSEWDDYFVPERRYFDGSLPRRIADSVSTIYSFEARKRLRALVRDARPDVAHLHNVYHQLSLSVVDELRAAGVPMLMTFHDYKAACPNYQLLTHDGLCQRCVGGTYWNAVRHRCLKGSVAGSVIAATEAYVNRLRGQYGKIDVFLSPSAFLRDVMVRAGLPAGRIDVLPNAVPVRSDARPGRRTAPSRPKFVYLGRLSSEKGVDRLLDAMPRVRAGVEVAIVGAGPLEPSLRARVDSERLPVRFAGFLDHAGVRRELADATATVLPSRCYENCPMSILEAGAAGVATIASAIGGIPELITSGVNGVLVPPDGATELADAMNDLADDPPKAIELGEAAWERVLRDHDEERYAAKLVRHYERVSRGGISS